jgi:hypothetical protein
MVWDDHEIRDGWGSFAGDSPTLAARYPRGAPITDLYHRYFEDARDVYWHFQACRNPLPPYVSIEAAPGYRRALPVVIRCGCLLVVILDSRGDRDVFRGEKPVLGAEQWTFLDELFQSIDPAVDALAVVTPAPIVCAAPDGQWQSLVGARTDDVDVYREGNLERLEQVRVENVDDDPRDLVANLAAAYVGDEIRSRFGMDANLGSFKVADIDDARDQWCHAFSRPEQEALIRAAVRARLSNRREPNARALLFVGGDLHAGGTLDLTVEGDPSLTVRCLISSGIGKNVDTSQLLGTAFDTEFDVAPGITARLREAIGDYNYGVVQVIPSGHGAEMTGTVVHKGNASAWGADLALRLSP